MTATTFSSRLSRWLLSSLALLLVAGLGATPLFAQEGGGSSSADQQKLKQLKQSFRTGLKAAKANNSSEAYTQLEQALQLAQETEQSGAANQITGYLQQLPKQWGNAAIENENWSGALTHFEKGIMHAENDAYMYYGKGLSLINMDSTETGLSAMQQAIQVGNETGNTRVSGLASDRVRGHFLNIASEALNGNNLSSSQISTALDALDEMRNYVEPNAETLFYRALALFERGSHEEAIQTAQQGLDMHEGSRSDAAKYYFVIAESQMRTGSKQQACQTFQNAAYGDYQARAEHYLKNECE